MKTKIKKWSFVMLISLLFVSTIMVSCRPEEDDLEDDIEHVIPDGGGHVVEQTCSRCDGTGICQSCDGSGKCFVCHGNYKKYDSFGYPVTCNYCTYGKCPGCNGNRRCNLCKGTGKR